MEAASSGNLSNPCISLYNGKEYIGTTLTSILIVAMTISFLLNLTFNLGVVYALVTTNQLKTMSLRLMCSLSVSDVCLAVAGQPLFIYMLITNVDGTTDCSVDTSVEFFVIFFAHTSAYIVVLIGFDRYFRMKYLNGYSALVKNWYFYVGLCSIVVLSLIETSLQVVGIQLRFYPTANFIAIGIDCCIFFLLILPYMLTLFAMRGHIKSTGASGILSKVDEIISKMSSRIVTSIIVMYLPYVIFCTMRIIVTYTVESDDVIMTSQWFNFCLFLGYVLGTSSSFVNAMIFLSFNKKSQRKLFRSCIKGEVERGESSSYKFHKTNQNVDHLMDPNKTSRQSSYISNSNAF